MKHKLQSGESLTVAAPKLDEKDPTLNLPVVKSGQGVLMGNLFGIASTDALSEELFNIDVVGVFDMEKVKDSVFAMGSKVYWDATLKQVSPDAKLVKWIGTACLPSRSADPLARVILNGFAIDVGAQAAT